MADTNVTPELRKENDYILETLTITSEITGKTYNFTSHIHSLFFEENLYMPSTHGQVIVKDAMDYVGLVPFIGQELIHFQFTRQDEIKKKDRLPPITFVGRIYSLTDKEIQSGSRKFQLYTLRFYSIPFVKNFDKRVSKSFKNKLNSEMVEIIFDEYLKADPVDIEIVGDGQITVPPPKEIEVAPTLGLHNYVIGNKKPIAVIDQLSERSSCPAGTGCHYVFYEARNAFKFETVGSILQKPPIREIKYEPRNLDRESQKEFDLARAMNIPHSLHEEGGFDIINDKIKGKNSSRLLKIDPIRRKIVKSDYNIEDGGDLPEGAWDNLPHTDDKKPFNENSAAFGEDGKFETIISDEEHDTVEHLISKDPDIRPDRLEKIIQIRNTQFQQVKNNQISVQLPGDPRYTVGETIEVVIPEATGIVSEKFPEEENKFVSGKYLITSATHILQDNRYITTMRLQKDGFRNEITNGKDIEALYKGKY
jgi:hypothetical protein